MGDRPADMGTQFKTAGNVCKASGRVPTAQSITSSIAFNSPGGELNFPWPLSSRPTNKGKIDKELTETERIESSEECGDDDGVGRYDVFVHTETARIGGRD
ncbi:unnamed protein product [Linum trigynum]|uniref:Uncharacterized protein n=1 Tax=Linum trigynum TaxID=586398 RepID=A0AAV2GIT3_9ROSI